MHCSCGWKPSSVNRKTTLATTTHTFSSPTQQSRPIMTLVVPLSWEKIHHWHHGDCHQQSIIQIASPLCDSNSAAELLSDTVSESKHCLGRRATSTSQLRAGHTIETKSRTQSVEAANATPAFMQITENQATDKLKLILRRLCAARCDASPES